ncbi:hypothetical protein R1sor_014685 [Riccia sorocarpa]|uniref:acetylglutamate kinase n=1 Tax=Riccia sorocarpa TaxID=122646 RepID=A0ABD3HEC1_9MARC
MAVQQAISSRSVFSLFPRQRVSHSLNTPSLTRVSVNSHGLKLEKKLLLAGARAQAVANEVVPKSGQYTAKDRVDILAEALPFIQRFQNKTVVVKYGGAAMKDPSLKDGVIKDLVLLACVGLRPVLVHGGGPEINSWLTKLGIEPKFKNGLRVTDAATMEVVEMVLVGKVNKSLVSLINRAGGQAVGLCGKDGKLLTARQVGGDLGFVGEITRVNIGVVKALVDGGVIPVIATVAADVNGDAYNINADTAAGEIAASLGAEKLILMTDVPGVMRNPKEIDTLIREATIKQVRGLVEEGVISGGMIPKVECCVRSLAQGVHAAHIIDGREPHSLLLEILTDEGAGNPVTEYCIPRRTYLWTQAISADLTPLAGRFEDIGLLETVYLAQERPDIHIISLCC